ncbi:hypothetical protein BC939DRAFT_505259 [Gamsiella multidivaricata]|uniref:uncharacterized protein n=1 Tax=Gamsiella multidivaricata TaxID=101098 RepID=UPI00221F6ADD|nr:uncharacterized protein BC939DRAFT_505259 [Gamsiella multidivaricata]KAG0353892.1 hypothetical protein BGZ54_001980 [Gamsiella multidivaricata]KAI7819996.1 hypothetical protein BC939DRAFT_505259 [Gamsiella multidivaricata]
MIDIHDLFEAALSATSGHPDAGVLNNHTASSLLCPIIHFTSTLTAAAASPYHGAICSSVSSPIYPSSASTGQGSSMAAASSSVPLLSATLSPVPHPSFLAHLFSLHEPLLFCNFDINPNTSVFALTFLAASIFQITGFYFLRHFVPQLSEERPKSRRGLSWVLTLFSSIVLFTGTFTLSSNMEWNPPGGSGSDGNLDGRWNTLLSLRQFPNESNLATMYSAYFVSYLICDLVLGMVYYRAYLDPLSGWAHHLGYLAVVSNATLQKNVSTLFAMGTPIEVSTIFLASGHIFPMLRSDLLFATSFFLSRILYPIVLLPELYLNVESRLCWKVALMALAVHVHWFRKFVQQQIRYYRAHQQIRDHKDSSVLESPAADEKTEEKEKKEKQDDGAVNECPVKDVPQLVKLSPPAVTEPFKDNMLEMDESVVNQVQLNGSHHRKHRPRVIRRVSRPTFEHLIDTSSVGVDLNSQESAAFSSPNRPEKTMKQLLEECDQEEFDYAMPLHNVLKGGNKTFSPLARQRLLSSQNSLESRGAVSRASSMRDTKRRIGLGAVRFEEPKDPQERQQEQQHSIQSKVERVQKQKEQMEGDATVVLKPRQLRTPLVMKKVSAEERERMGQKNGEYDFGTIRMARGVAIQA